MSDAERIARLRKERDALENQVIDLQAQLAALTQNRDERETGSVPPPRSGSDFSRATARDIDAKFENMSPEDQNRTEEAHYGLNR